jgi:hypothetical protein
MGRLGAFLQEAGHEHAYCTDNVFHLTASLAFSGKLLFGKLEYYLARMIVAYQVSTAACVLIFI